jgi:hypothetical protein
LPCGSVTSIELPASISGSCPVTLTALGATFTVAPLIGLVAVSELALAAGEVMKSATTAMLKVRVIFIVLPLFVTAIRIYLLTSLDLVSTPEE